MDARTAFQLDQFRRRSRNHPLSPFKIPTVQPPWLSKMDSAAMRQAGRLDRWNHGILNAGMTQTYSELFFRNTADYTSVSNTTSQSSLLSGIARQPVLPAFTIDLGQTGPGKTYVFEAMGVLSTTSTPTLTFQAFLGTTAGASSLSGTTVGVSKAITTSSGVTNQWWYMKLILTAYVVGIGSGATTLSGAGWLDSPGGFASPFKYILEPTTPDTATWTSTLDLSATQYFNFAATWSAASSSNNITCKSLLGYCLN